MKIYSLMITCLLFSFISGPYLVAQSPISQKKSSQFSRVPSFKETFEKDFHPKDIRKYIDQLFNETKIGDTINIPVNSEVLAGKVIMKSTKGSHITVMNLRIENYDGALLYITRKEKALNKFEYYSTVHHPNYSDALVLKHVNEIYFYVSDFQSNVLTD